MSLYSALYEYGGKEAIKDVLSAPVEEPVKHSGFLTPPRKTTIGPLIEPKHTKWKRGSKTTMLELLAEGKLNEGQVRMLALKYPRKAKQALRESIIGLDINTKQGASALRSILKLYPDLLE
jgi:hypothetical protein